MLFRTKPSIYAVRRIIEQKTGEKIRSISDLTDGLDHWVYAGRFKRKNAIIRFPKKRKYRQHILTTARLYKEWKETGIPAPIPLFVSRDLMIETRIPGKPLSKLSLSFKRRKEIYFQLGKILRKMHSVHRKKYGEMKKDGNGSLPTWKEVLEKGIKDSFRALRKERYLTKEELYQLKSIFDHHFHFIQKGSVLHGDIKPEHVFVYEGKLSGLVDAADVLVGDPMYEFGEIQLQLMNKPELESVIQGYGKVNRDAMQAYALYTLAWRVFRYPNRRKMRIFKIKKILRESKG